MGQTKIPKLTDIIITPYVYSKCLQYPAKIKYEV